MRKRIQQLARGKFEYARPLLTLSTDKIEIEVLEGKDYTGDFVITSANRVPMRGIVYTSNPRMECLTPQFEGEEVRIRYQFHTDGLMEGDVLTGKFFLICNQGEYDLSFAVSISRLYADSSAGRIRTLGDFVKLASVSFGEAARLFESPNFKNILKSKEHREMLLYDGLSRTHTKERALEEFLLGCHKKKPVEFTLEEVSAELPQTEQTTKERLTVKKSGWGCVDVSVTSDAAFLQPSKERLTQEDFIGSTCIFEYYVQAEKMHAGRNYGRLFFVSSGQTLEFTVCAVAGCREEQRAKDHREIEQAKAKLTGFYVDYRLKRIVTGVWANRTIELLDHLMALHESNPLYTLMKAQALIANKQRQEAAWIMEDFKREWKDHASPVWGYYLYLCTLLEREPSYVDRLGEEIEEIFKRHPEDTVLFWILLFMKEEYYLDNGKRLKAIERRMKGEGHDGRENCSPYLYLEAYYLIWQDPYLLVHLNDFEIRVLNWARKQNAISKDMALQIMSLLPEKREFDPFLYRILEACYQVEDSEEMLAAICAYLIRGQCYGVSYHRWYALGIEREIRLAGLYEAYLLSLDRHQVCQVPRMLQMYFQYNSSLPYRQKAVLYVNIIAGKQKQPEVYQKYRRNMEQFAMEQLEAGHMDDNLAVVYRELLEQGVINAEIAKNLSRVLFTCKLVCHDRRIQRVIVQERALKQSRTVTLTEGEAYFPLYTEEYCILLEDAYGNRFAESIPFRVEPLMNPERCLQRCMELAPEQLPFLLYSFRGRTRCGDFLPGDEKNLARLLSAEPLSDRYKADMCPEIIRFYQERSRQTNEVFALEQYLSGVEPAQLSVAARRYLLNLLSEAHLYDKAYRMAQLYGYDYMELSGRVSLCSYGITSLGYEEDDFLLGFVQTTFARGKYSDIMLIYLCKYYNGSTKNMAKLWKAAGEFQIDTFDLEERILTQMLYTTEYIAEAEDIYDSYYAGGGRETVCMAYLSYFADCYLVYDTVVPVNVFLQLADRLKKGQELPDVCRLGLLKYFAAEKDWFETQLKLADELLADYVERNICFSFFKQLDTRLLIKYQLYDKFFVEYHAAPGSGIRIRFSLDGGEYQEEELTEMYDGIFVREFVLFFGETLQYYVLEDDGPREKVTESGQIDNRDVPERQSGSRYAMLNEMLVHSTLQDNGKLRRLMKNYHGMQHVTEEAFKLL